MTGLPLWRVSFGSFRFRQRQFGIGGFEAQPTAAAGTAVVGDQCFGCHRFVQLAAFNKVFVDKSMLRE